MQAFCSSLPNTKWLAYESKIFFKTFLMHWSLCYELVSKKGEITNYPVSSSTKPRADSEVNRLAPECEKTIKPFDRKTFMYGILFIIRGEITKTFVNSI